MQYKVVVNSVNESRKLKEYIHGQFYNNLQNVILDNPEKEYYESIFIYNDDHKNQFETTGSLAGIKQVYSDKLIFDFDSKLDRNLALNDTRALVTNLLKYVPENTIRCSFSGNKGFHVEIYFNEGQLLNLIQFKGIVDNLASGLDTFDTVVKDAQRIIRLNLSWNKAGYYKTPIDVETLLNPDLIIEDILNSPRCKNPKDQKNIDLIATYQTCDIPQQLLTLATIGEIEQTQKIVKAKPNEVPTMTQRPKHLSPAKFALMQGYFDEGERHQACMVLCATYRGLGYPKDIAYNMLKATLRMRSERLGIGEYDTEELYNNVVSSVYSLTWEGGTYSEKTGILAKTIDEYQLEKSSNDEVGLVNILSISSIFKDFAENIDKNTIKLGIKELDTKLRITTSMLVCLLAPPSAGKSSISFGILNTISKSNEKSIFFSMDMAVPQVYQRLIQRHTGSFADIITDSYKNQVVDNTNNYERILEEEYKNVKFCFKTGLTPDMIRNTILNECDTTGIMPKLVVIDYLECIAGPFSDATANKALIATQLKDIANELGVCVLLLVQPAKVSGDPSNELTSYTQIKGSSVLGEAATVVLTMYRPGFSPKRPADDNYLTINVVKNRMGSLSTTELHWEGITGSLRSLTSEEHLELNNVKARKAAELSGEGNNMFGSNKKEMF